MRNKIKSSFSKKPFSNKPSKFVLECLSKLELPISSLVLDLPCGYGRHSALLSNIGYTIYSIDLDFTALKYIEDISDRIVKICIDITQGIPFKSEIFDLIIIVDYVQKGLLSCMDKFLKPGGYLIYKTYGGHGQNWITLPRMGETMVELGSNFKAINLTEKPVKPKECGRVSTKLLAQKLLFSSYIK